MPIAMNFDFLSTKTSHNGCDHLTECQGNIETKYSKSPLANGTNRSSAPAVPLKPCLRSPIHRIPRQLDLEQLTRDSYTRQFPLANVEERQWLAVASNDEYVLVGGGDSSTLQLLDFHGKEIRTINIKTFAAFDLAWSNVLNAFLIAGYDGLQIYHAKKNQLTQVENLNLNNKKENYYWSIACYDHDLFVVLSDGLESIWRLSLPDFQRTQTLSGSVIRESDADDRISCIRTNGRLIGMTLRQHQTYQWRVDLFDYVTMVRTHRGLTIGYGNGAFNFTERCMLAPIDDHQWLIIGGYKVKPNALTLMNDRTGEIKQIERRDDQQDEYICNISTSEKSQQEQIISMIIMNEQNELCQMRILEL